MTTCFAMRNKRIGEMLTEHAHHWILRRSEPFISKGVCYCGAVKYFSNCIDDDEVTKRVNQLNKQHEKRGIAMVNDRPIENKASIPPKPSNRYQMRQYYDDNKNAILDDLKQLGKRAMWKKWGISQATWCSSKNGQRTGLAIRWGLIDTPSVKLQSVPPCPPEPPPPISEVVGGIETKTLPPFPAFDNSWPMSTQIEWLRTYKELAKG